PRDCSCAHPRPSRIIPATEYAADWDRARPWQSLELTLGPVFGPVFHRTPPCARCWTSRRACRSTHIVANRAVTFGHCDGAVAESVAESVGAGRGAVAGHGWRRGERAPTLPPLPSEGVPGVSHGGGSAIVDLRFD